MTDIEENMNGYEKILFDIDMQLYDEFNDKFCEMYEHLGDIYSYKDLQDLKECEKDTKIHLLQNKIKELMQVIEEMSVVGCVYIPARFFKYESACITPKFVTEYFMNKMKENKEC